MKSKILILYILLLCLGCKTTFENFNKKSEKNQLKFIECNLNDLKGSDLGNFIYQLQQENVDFVKYNSLFKEKLKNSEFAYDLYILTDLLLQYPKNKIYLESILNHKTSIWDSGNWGDKFWKIISDNNLKVTYPNYYSVNKGIRNYDFTKFLSEKIANDELGTNPLLMINYDIVDYENEKLIETIDTLNIKQIDYLPKSKSVLLFGKRGKDGKIDILTK